MNIIYSEPQMSVDVVHYKKIPLCAYKCLSLIVEKSGGKSKIFGRTV